MEEFSGTRSQLYKECLREYPQAREQDIRVMKKYLAPQADETILEVGAGSGFFSGELADMVEKLYVSDPSKEQLDEVSALHRTNIEVIQQGADALHLGGDIVDAIWSFGTIHHLLPKTKAFTNFYTMLKPGARLVIVDVMANSNLAQHFDEKVAKYCVTGHEVSFMSHEYAQSLCFLAGFETPVLEDLDIQWWFETKKDIGIFLYKLHAMTKTTPEECLRGAEEILGIEERAGKFFLNWPLTVLTTKKP